MSFDESNNSLRILDYFDTKYGQLIAPVGLFKVCAAVSSQLEWPRLSIYNVAPSGQFKSQTSIEAESMFPKFVIKAGSDFTLPGLFNQTKGDVDKKCITVNDGTILIRSKTSRGKYRLMGGIAEVLSESEYTYADYAERQKIKGRCTFIINMTLSSFIRNERDLADSTMLERFLTVFHNMPLSEQEYYWDNRVANSIKAASKKPKDLQLKFKKIANLDEYKQQIKLLIGDFSTLSGRAWLRQADAAEALVKAHAILNDRFYICRDDIELLKLAREYLSNPASPNRSKIIMYALQDRSVKDICLLLGQDPDKYKAFVGRVMRDAKNEGILN